MRYQDFRRGKIMVYIFRPIDKMTARIIAHWRYDPPYDYYNTPAEEIEAAVANMLNPANAYHTIYDEQGDLVGSCCFGEDAQVSGGDYQLDALDIGLGMRPDLTGQGRGDAFFTAICDFAQRQFRPRRLRLTVAAFNGRARRTYERAGFCQTQIFRSRYDGQMFLVMIKQKPQTA
jgi:[ribosomal protein S18]-alanine N-acetyltransferase